VRVAIVVYEGFDDLDAFGPFEVLANAALALEDLSVALVTLDPVDEVGTSHGASIRPAGVLGEDAELLVIPGGGWNDHAEHGARAQARGERLPGAIRSHHAAGGMVASVCTGAGIVAASGILDGREATTHHRARAELREHGVEIVDARVVDDGEIISAGGVTAGIDLALHLVERTASTELADLIAREMEYERRGPVHMGRLS
jgi:transcriptional regulator GlxA family with amidase domain